MSPLTRMLVLFVVIVHALIFVVETFLWMTPAVYQFVLSRLGGPAEVAPHDQALILRSLFINQGFYNFFLAMAGLTGVILVARGHISAGRSLAAYACLSAVGAGLVLLFSTHAWIGAVLQAAPAVAALGLMVRHAYTQSVPASAQR